jgi:hypothetical protein
MILKKRNIPNGIERKSVFLSPLSRKKYFSHLFVDINATTCQQNVGGRASEPDK